MATLQLRLATFNIRNTTDRYELRRPMLGEVVSKEIVADVIGLQEVAFENPDAQTRFLAEELKINNPRSTTLLFEAHLQTPILKPLVDPSFRIDGNSIIIHSDKISQVLRHETLVLSPVRTAQRILIEVSSVSSLSSTPTLHFWFINLHLHHVIPDSEIRRQQIEKVLAWMNDSSSGEEESFFQDIPQIIVGDLNSPPNEPTISSLKEAGFHSCHFEVHGKEPLVTFPTGLIADTMDTDPPDCFDYIWFKSSSKVKIGAVRVELCGNKGHPTHFPPVFPSDHLAMWGDFNFIWSPSGERA